jgi:hypothetical protein
MEDPTTWAYCDPSKRKFTPVLLNPGPDADRQFWLVDGKIRGHVCRLLEHVGKHRRGVPCGDYQQAARNVPKLRFGFIEASASWLTWVFKDIKRRAEGRKLPDDFFEAHRLYVSCYSSTDNIEYIAQYSTQNVLMTGANYGHVDMSVEIDALRSLEKNGKVRPELARNILCNNPARFTAYIE